MCGRYTLIANANQLSERFTFDAEQVKLNPGYNIAPGQMILAVTTDDNSDHLAQFMRWGLIPFWSKNANSAARMVNARSETIHAKLSFSAAFRSRRCIIPADGFYEWIDIEGARRPVRMSSPSDELFSFAGLWESWQNPQGTAVLSCTIVTAPANGHLGRIHHRMPFILAPESESIWLNPGGIDHSQLSHLLDSDRLGNLEAYEVSAMINSPFNNLPDQAKRLCRVL